MSLFERELLISCGEARERMMNSGLTKNALKLINQIIKQRSKQGYETAKIIFSIDKYQIMDDVTDVLKQKGYEVTESSGCAEKYLTISWKIKKEDTK